MTDVNREIRLVSRPQGFPRPENFELVETPVPEPGEGEILVRNAFMSVDPYMRGRMNDVKSYVPPFQIGEALQGGVVGDLPPLPGRNFECAHNYSIKQDVPVLIDRIYTCLA